MPEDHKKHLKHVVEEVAEEKPVEEPVVEDPQEPPKVETVVENVEETPEAVEEKPVENKKMNLKLVVAITLVSSLVAAFVSGGVYVYLSSVESAKPEPQATSTPAPSATPEPTATAEPEPVDLSKYSVRVLNGSGAIGAAGAGEDVLVKAGFTVKATGNAANYNFKSTVVQTKSGVPADVVSKAKEALEKADYKVEVGEALPSSSQYDMVITMGPN